MPLVAVFIRDGQNRSIYLPKVVPGGSCVTSIKTAHDNNYAKNNKINTNNKNDIVHSGNHQSGVKRIYLSTICLLIGETGIKSNQIGVLVRGESWSPRGKTTWNKVEKQPYLNPHMTSAPESNLGHIGCYETKNVSVLITMTTQLHKEPREGSVQENVLYP